MTVEITIVLAAITLIFNIYTGISNMKRGDKKDAMNDGSQIASLNVKLDSISDGIREIKAEVTNIKKDVKEDHDLIIRIDESTKQAHKRIDEFLKGTTKNVAP